MFLWPVPNIIIEDRGPTADLNGEVWGEEPIQKKIVIRFVGYIQDSRYPMQAQFPADRIPIIH